MKNLLLFLGMVGWFVVGSALVISTHQKNQQVLADQNKARQIQTVKNKASVQTTAQQLKITQINLSAAQNAESQVCMFSKTAQADLLKYKISLALPAVCQ